MTAILAIFGVVLLVVVWNSVYDHILFKKFKVGYSIELYYLKHVALDFYEKAGVYKIIARKGSDISVRDLNDTILDYDIRVLVSKYDKIIIKDEYGCTYEILNKIESYNY